MICAKTKAFAVKSMIDHQIKIFSGQPDYAGQRIHGLFVELYQQTTHHWLAELEKEIDPDIAYLVIPEFYSIYETMVVDHQFSPLHKIPKHWRRYHKLARRLTIRSSIFSHLLLISLGVRAHVRHDLGNAVVIAARNYRFVFGRAPSQFDLQNSIIGPASARAFFNAAQEYITHHRRQQNGWRKLVLSAFSGGLAALQAIWLPVLQSWRQRSIDDAMQPNPTG